ncbi:MAG: 2-hydroxyacyl-CoA dehydratase family protein, partial [Smithellaceae bacterium]|nr:2-hydroxyacyl-CoA dehydratase family protein [Smithellaceae bacterium]
MNQELEELVRKHRDILKDEKAKTGRPVFGTVCSYVPVEILHSFGITSVRLWGVSENIGLADELMQSFICPPARHLMALGLSGHYDFLDGIIHSYSCDATCGLFNIWKRRFNPPFAWMISPPYIDTEESRSYTEAELGQLITAIEEFTGKVYSSETLGTSIALYNEARSSLRGLYGKKGEGAPYDYSDIYHMNVLFQVLPPETFLPVIRRYAAAEKHRNQDKGKKRILISGSVVNDVSLLRSIAQLGGVIVTDDTCLGLRTLQGAIPRDGDPLDDLIAYYLRRPPCASRADFAARRIYLS